MLHIQALDKLSSRLSSPSPNARASKTPSRSPQPPAANGSRSSDSSSSHASSSSSRLAYQPRRSETQDHSGSETEREREYTEHDHDLHPQARPVTPQAPHRIRLASAPVSPAKALKALAPILSSGTFSNSNSNSNSNSSTSSKHVRHAPAPDSPRTARKRASLVSSSARSQSPDEQRDITRAALAAVASSRTNSTLTSARFSPTAVNSGAKRRQPLPREWGVASPAMEGKGRRGSLDGVDGGRVRLFLRFLTFV